MIHKSYCMIKCFIPFNIAYRHSSHLIFNYQTYRNYRTKAPSASSEHDDNDSFTTTNNINHYNHFANSNAAILTDKQQLDTIGFIWNTRHYKHTLLMRCIELYQSIYNPNNTPNMNTATTAPIEGLESYNKYLHPIPTK